MKRKRIKGSRAFWKKMTPKFGFVEGIEELLVTDVECFGGRYIYLSISRQMFMFMCLNLRLWIFVITTDSLLRIL
jgi:hypothetical protein